MKYVGADGHKDSVTFCVMGNSGKVNDIFELEASPEGMDRFMERMGDVSKYKVMFESGTYTTDLYLHLASRDVQAYVANARSLSIIGDSRKKTDSNDAVAIARYLRLWDRNEIELSISHIVSGDNQRLRDLCRLREELADKKGRELQRIKSHMRRNGEYVDESEYPDLSTEKALSHILDTFTDDFVLCERVREYMHYKRRCKDIDGKLEASVIMQNECKLLESIPGIGRLTATEICSMVVDIDRFTSAGRFRSYFGMAPAVKNSGGKTNIGHLTKRGDRMMRKILYRAVFVHMRFNPEGHISRFHEKAVSRMGRKKALTAAANKFLDLIYAVLKRGTPFHA